MSRLVDRRGTNLLSWRQNGVKQTTMDAGAWAVCVGRNILCGTQPMAVPTLQLSLPECGSLDAGREKCEPFTQVTLLPFSVEMLL